MSRLEDAQRGLSPFRYMRLPGGDLLYRALKLIDGGSTAKAILVLNKLVASQPEMAAAHLFLGLALDAQGKRAAAVKAIDAALTADLDEFDELCLIADALLDWDQPEKAAAAFRRAIARAPHAAQGFWGLGRAESRLGDTTAALRNLEKAALLQPSFTAAHIDLGHEYRATNLKDAAIASYRRALELDPENQEAELGLDAVIASMVPQWHYAMVNDARRNRAFDRAIRTAVDRNSRVLDIGTGTGLMAMMAARAGARQVTACEAVTPMAEVAEEIVAANGFADRIAIVRKKSTAMEIGRDMAQRANVLVAEVVDAGLLSEGVIDSIAHARANLLTRGARIIPARATVFAMAIESKQIDAERRVGRAAGFDVGAMNSLAPRLYLQTDLNRYEWRGLSRALKLFEFDFAAGAIPPAQRRVPFTATGTGTCHAIAFWFRLDLDDEISIATGPTSPPTHWQQAVYSLNPPMKLTKGAKATLIARHDRSTIFLDLARG